MEIVARNTKAEYHINPQVFKRLGVLLRNEIISCFVNATDPYGKTWPPLSPKTIARRRGQSNKPLIDTGTLMNSIGFQAAKNSVIVGASTAAPYAPFHQFGADNIPQRQFIPDAKNLPNKWTDLINNTLKNAVQISIRN